MIGICCYCGEPVYEGEAAVNKQAQLCHKQCLEEHSPPQERQRTCGECKWFHTEECPEEHPDLISTHARYAERCPKFTPRRGEV